MADTEENHTQRREPQHPVYARTRNRLLSGLLVLVPFAITLMVLLWLFGRLSALLRPIVEYWLTVLKHIAVVEVVPDVVVRATLFVVSLLLLLALIYMAGVFGQAVLGRRLIGLVERVVLGIPLARNIYTAAKQVIEAVAMRPKTAFQMVVLVEFPCRGYRAVAFLTGRCETPDGRQFCRVFIPTTPAVTTGFFEIVPASEVIETNLTVEDAFKMLISGGLVASDQLAAAL